MTKNKNKLNFDFSFLGNNEPQKDISADEISKQMVSMSDSNQSFTKIKYEECDNKRIWIFSIIAIMIIVLFFGVIFISINANKKAEAKRILNEKIATQENIVYENLKNNKVEYMISIHSLADLTQKSVEELDEEMHNRFANEKADIISQIATAWENNKEDFENLKKENISIFFNNNEKEFNKAIETQLGYKALTLVEKSMPQSGIIKNYTGKEAIAPFEINPAYGDSDNYFIKLVDYYTDKTAVTIFVRSGETVKVDVPLGNYKIKYATGQTWYGEKDLFGHKTNYSKSNEMLSFESDGYRVSGHTLTLYKVQNGNFSTEKMNAEEF